MSGSIGQPTQAWMPFVATKTNTNWATRTNASGELGMGRLDTNTTAQNNLLTNDLYMDSVTWKVALVHRTGPDRGIYNVTGISGTQTIDGYSVGATDNVYSEVTGIALTTPGVKTVQVQMATKNAGSSAYGGSLQSCAFIATSGSYSTPSGTDTPGYTWQTHPWMGTKANTNFATRTQSSSELGGGRLVSDTTAQNNAFSQDVWKDTGTYKVALVYGKDADQGIHNITGLNGTQTVDAYAAAPASNNYSEVTGIAVATAAVATLADTMATKNASASAYGGKVNSLKIVRTGA